MAKKKPLRAPFITVAVLMAPTAIGCGGKFELGAPEDGGLSDSLTDTPVANGCPATLPANDTPCAPESQRCDYSSGSTCPVSTARCFKGRWQVSATSCNPPPPTCPTIEPIEGSPCSGLPGVCFYRDLCTEAPAGSGTHYECQAGIWHATKSKPYAVPCPTAAPKNGETCNCEGHYPSECRYGNCYGQPTEFATCKGRTWQVINATCNPPPPYYDGGIPPSVDGGGGSTDAAWLPDGIGYE